MKTNFPQRNRANTSFKARLSYAILVFFAALLFFTYLGSSLVTLLSPIWKSDTYIHRGVKNTYMSLRSKDYLLKENEDLKSKLRESDELIISLRTLSTSRDELLKTFGREVVGLPASVLARPPKTPYDILIIDAGLDHGVRVGALVGLPEGSIVGSITEVLSDTSRVRLFSSAGERTDSLLERGRVPVELQGRGGGNFLFIVPRDTAVEIGDRILTAHTVEELVGVVGDIEVSPTDAFKTVYARSVTNPTNLSKVIIK